MANGAAFRLSLQRISALLPAKAAQPQVVHGLVRDVSLDLEAGHCLALLGDQQAGGSLLLDLVAGHATASMGRIVLHGKEMTTQTPASRRLGMASPRDPLFSHLNVRDNIAFSLRAAGVAADERARRVGDALALLGLEGLATHRPSSLDREAQIRTAIARALASEPCLILLDNPFAILDPGPRQALQRTLRRLVQARRLTVLLTTSDRDEALLLGDQIGILEAGRLHQVGPAQALLDRPCDPVVAARLGDANLLTGQVIATDDEAAVVRLSCGHEMEAEPGEPLEKGTLCVLCVRPDRIATAFLNRPGSDVTAGSLPATLTDTVHFGDHLRLRFRLQDGSEMLVRRPPAAIVGEMRPGRSALLAWQPHQARVFAATSR